MPDPWSNSGLDLHLVLPHGPGVRVALEDALRDAVRAGRLRPGMRLPPSRALAKDLGIARNTVAGAYGQLVAEGWLVAQQGAGTRVGERSAALDKPPAAPRSVPRRARYDLRPGSPDLSAFPRSGWLSAARRALNSAPNEALGYGDPRGRLELRRALTDYLARARGVRLSADRVVICSGFAQGLALLCQALRARGATVMAMEQYTGPNQRDTVLGSGLSVQTLPVDEQGAAVGELGDADAVILTPAHQFPIGAALSAERRARAVAWLSDTGGLLLEDDYDGEFRYDRQPVGALQALTPERVAYAGTASKSLAPGLRLGWLALPGHLVDEIIAIKTLADRQSSTLDQLTLAEFITSGAYDRHIRRSRLAYRRRRDRLVSALQRRAPDVRITGVAAGLHVLVELAPGQREDETVARAARHGLAVEGLGAYSNGTSDHRPALVVGYATPPEHAFTGSIARLCAVLGDASA